MFFKPLLASLFIGLPHLANAQEMRIPIDQAPRAVEQLLAQGHARAALEIAVAAQKVSPNNPNFLIALARTQLALGNFDAAIAAGTAAWGYAPNDQIRFVAADTVAAAHFKAGNFSRSQFWLRRAREFAPNQALANRIAKNFGTVRAANPWSTSFRIGAAPSSNINNGSANATASLFGFPGEFTLNGEARALSGYQISASLNTSYRLSQSATASTFFTAGADAQTYTLSSAAQEQAPDASGADYATSNASVGLRHTRIFKDGWEPTNFTFKTGKTWSAGKQNTTYTEASLSQAFVINPQNTLVTWFNTRRRNSLSDQPVVDSYNLAASLRQTYANKDSFAFGVTLSRSKSDMPDSDYSAVKLSGNYYVAKPIAGMRFGFGLDAEQRKFDASIYNPGPREDRSATARLSVEFSQVEFYGFRSVMNIEATRNLSTVDLFDRDYSSIGFDLRSSF